MYNWAEYIDLENIEEFKTRYNIGEFTYDIYDSNEALLTKLDGGATGLYDISSPTAEFVKVMADKGYIVEVPFDRMPNTQLINPTFQNFYDPAGPDAKYNGFHVPKDWGTTGIAVRKKVVTEDVRTWKQFFEVAPKYSGRIVMVESAGDVMTAPLKALGYSLNSTDPSGARRGPGAPPGPRPARPGARLERLRRQAGHRRSGHGPCLDGRRGRPP